MGATSATSSCCDVFVNDGESWGCAGEASEAGANRFNQK